MKKAIIISSIIASLAVLTYGAFSMSGKGVTIANEEYDMAGNYAGYSGIRVYLTDGYEDIYGAFPGEYWTLKQEYEDIMKGVEIYVDSIGVDDYDGKYEFIEYEATDPYSGDKVTFGNKDHRGFYLKNPVYQGVIEDLALKIEEQDGYYHVSCGYDFDILAKYKYVEPEKYKVSYLPVIYEDGKKTPNMTSGGGTTRGGGIINSYDNNKITLFRGEANEGYSLCGYELYAGDEFIGRTDEIYKNYWEVTYNKSGTVWSPSDATIGINKDITVYAMFVKGVIPTPGPTPTPYPTGTPSPTPYPTHTPTPTPDKNGVLFVYEAWPHMSNVRIDRKDAQGNRWIVAPSQEGVKKVSYLISKGDNNRYMGLCDFDHYRESYISIDGGPLTKITDINSVTGVNFEEKGNNYWFKIDWSKKYPKTIYVYDWGSPEDAYKCVAVTHAVPEEGGTTSANPTQQKEPFSTQLTATPAKGYKFDYWEDSSGKKYEQPNIQQRITGINGFTAYFKPGVYEVSVASYEPLGGGYVTSGLGTYNYNDTPKLTIEVSDPNRYELESWSYITADGVNHSTKFKEGTTKSEVTLPKITEDIFLHITFRSKELKIRTNPAPNSGDSTAYIAKTSKVGTAQEIDALIGETVYLKAKPGTGYTFQYWTNNKGEIIRGTKGSDGSYTASLAVKETDTFVAHFAGSKLEYSIESNVNNRNIGIIYLNGSEFRGGIYPINRGDYFTLKAQVTDSSYTIKKWLVIDPEGKQTEIPDEPSGITVSTGPSEPPLDGRYVYRAIFEKKKVEISAVPSILGKGNITIESNGVKSESGSLSVDAGSTVTITYTADAENKYWVTGWQDKDGTKMPDSSTRIDASTIPYKFILTIDKANETQKYTAKVNKLEPTLYVSSSPYEYGKVAINNETPSSFIERKVVALDEITLKATPSDPTKYQFVEWRVEGKQVSTLNPYPIDVPADDISYEAVFAPIVLNLTASVNSSEFGDVAVMCNDVSPSYSSYVTRSDITPGDKVTLMALSKNVDRYVFDHWEKGNNGDYLSSDRVYVFDRYLEADNTTYKAVFKDTVPAVAYIQLNNNDPDYDYSGKSVQIYEKYDDKWITGTDEETGATKIVIKYTRGDALELWSKIDPNASYEFDKWQLTDKNGEVITLTTNPASISTEKLRAQQMVDGTVYINALLYYKKINCTVNATAKPLNGGVVRIDDKKNGGSKKQVKKNDLVKLYAIPEPGYVFDYWSDGSTRLQGKEDEENRNINVLTLPAVTNDENITAYFAKEKSKVEFICSPTTGGTIDRNFYGATPDDEGYVPLHTRGTFKAVPLDGYKFVKWEWVDWDTGQKTSSTNDTLDFNDISNDVVFTAFFRKNTHKFTVTNEMQLENVQPLPDTWPFEIPLSYSSSDHTLIVDNMPDGEKMNIILTILRDGFQIDYIKDNHDRIYSDFRVDPNVNNKYYFETPPITEDDLVFTIYSSDKKGTLSIKTSPADAGLIKYGNNDFVSSGEYDISKKSNVTVEAKVTDPLYRFKYFEYVLPGKTADEKPTHYSSSSNPFTLFDAGDTWKDINTLEVIAVFEKIANKVDVAADPQTGGKVLINNEFTELIVNSGEGFALTAIPAEGYSFDYFTDSEGTRYPRDLTGEDYRTGFLKIPSVNADTTYTAHFTRDYLNINVYTNPTGGGTFIFKDDNVTEKETNLGGYSVNYGENFTLTAYPANGYKFERWDIEDSEGNKSTVSYNPLNVSEIKYDTDYTAIFVPIKSKVRTAVSPLDGGSVTLDGGVTEKEIGLNETLTITATPAEGYRFDCLKDSKGVKYDGTEDSETGVFTFTIPNITGDETFTGYFVKEQLSVTISCIPSEGGLLKVDGNIVDSGHIEMIDGGGSITVSVEPRDPEVYKFVRWEDDEGNSYPANPLTLNNIKKNIKLTAILNKEADKIGFKVIASPAIGGHTTKIINGKDSATIKAKANRGYKFVCWKKGKELISKKAEAEVTDLSDGVVYTAYFTKSSSYDAGSGIADEHYYDEKRKETAPTYSVTEDGMKIKANAQIQVDKNSPANSLPAEKTYAAYGKVQEYFDNHKKNNQYVFSDGELFTTKNEHMPIEMIPTETDVLALAEEFSYKKYGKIYDTEILAAVDVSMPIDFAEGPRTYIWKNVDAQFKDNMYVLYLTEDNEDYKWATGVYDMYDDVEQQVEGLRFSIPGDGRIFRIVAVRVSVSED